MGNKTSRDSGGIRTRRHGDDHDSANGKDHQSRKHSGSGDATRVFLPSELNMLHAMFRELEQKDHTMDKGTFLSFFKVPGMLGERLFAVFDNNHDGAIDYDEFIEGLATYVRGTKEQRIELLFHMYDLNDNGQVGRKELSMMLHSLVDPTILATLPEYVTHASRLSEAAKALTPKLTQTPVMAGAHGQLPTELRLASDAGNGATDSDASTTQESTDVAGTTSNSMSVSGQDNSPEGDFRVVQSSTGMSVVEEDDEPDESADRVGGLPEFASRQSARGRSGVGAGTEAEASSSAEDRDYDHNPIIHDPFDGPINVVHEVNVAAAIGIEEEKWVVDRIVEYAFKTCDPDSHGFLSLARFIHWIDKNPCVMSALESVFSKQQCWLDPRSRDDPLTLTQFKGLELSGTGHEGLNVNVGAPNSSPSSGFAPAASPMHVGDVSRAGSRAGSPAPSGTAQVEQLAFSRSASGASSTSAAGGTMLNSSMTSSPSSAFDAGMRGLLQNLRPLQQVLLCDHCGFACRHCHLCGSPLEVVQSQNVARCTNTTTGTCGRWTTEGLLTFCLQCGHRMQPDPAVIAQKVAAAAATAAAAAPGSLLEDQGFTTLRRETTGSVQHLPTLPSTSSYRPRTADREDEKAVAYEGYLFKRSGIVRQWKARYVVIRDGFMYIFKEREDVSPRSVTFLEECFIEIPDEVEQENEKYFGFELITKTQKYMFYARSFHERKAWVSHLRRAAKTQNVAEFYDLKKQIGKGKFATVYEATHRSSGRPYAVKVVSKSLIEGNQHEQEALRAEIAIMKLVSHPNIIHMKEVFKDHHNIYIVMPLIAHGDLFDRIIQRRVFAEDSARLITWKLLSALDYLHERGIIHRDLKPENILMEDKDDDTKVVLADFGLSIFSTPDQVLQMNCGTISYVAPEVLTHKGYSKMVDMWSLGVIVYVLLCGELPFQGRTQAHVIRQTLHGALVFTAQEWKTISADARDFVSQLLEKDPELRPSTSRAMQHPWFEALRKKEAQRLSSLRKSMSVENLTKSTPSLSLQGSHHPPSAVAAAPIDGPGSGNLGLSISVDNRTQVPSSHPSTPSAAGSSALARATALNRVSTPSTPLATIAGTTESLGGCNNSMGCAAVSQVTTSLVHSSSGSVSAVQPEQSQAFGSPTASSSPANSILGDSFAQAEAASLANATSDAPKQEEELLARLSGSQK